MKITQSILSELAQLTFKDNTVQIVRPLDRKTYVDLNKVLEACGGKWNKSAKVHIFPGDAAEALDVAIVTGEVATASEMNFFPTSAADAADLVAWAFEKAVPGPVSILEPSAGKGAIVKAAMHKGPVDAVELDERHRKDLEALGTGVSVRIASFFDLPVEPRYSHIPGNPPFAKVVGFDGIDHFRRCYEFLRPGGCQAMIMPKSIEWRDDRRHSAFRTWLDERGAERQLMASGSFKHAKTNVEAVRVRLYK